MNNKILTIALILFMGFAFLNEQKRKDEPKQPKPPLSAKDSELLEKIRTYIKIFTDDPQENTLRSKNEPILVASNEVNNKKRVNIDSNNQQDKQEQLSAMQNRITNILYNVLHTTQGQTLLDKILTTEIDDKKQKEPNPYLNNSILNVLDGEGKSAECGDVVKVHYITRLVNGQVIEDTRKNNAAKTFQIGDSKVIRGIEYAAIGMKKGGLRRLIIPPRLAYTEAKFSKNLVADNEFITMDIELIDIKFSLEDWKNKINIFQAPEENKGPFMLCGNKIYFNYKISDTNEKVLLESKGLVHFMIGSSEVPPAINKAFSGIKAQAKRLVMIPSSLLYNQKVSFFPQNAKLPEKGMLIFDIDTGFHNDK